MIKSFFNNVLHSIITLVCFILIILVVLFSNRTGQIDINVGDVSSADIYAPRAVIDTVTTNARRDAAKGGVENVYIIDDNIRASALDNINELFAQATSYRTASDFRASTSGALKLQADVKLQISADTAYALLSATESEFSQLRRISDIVGDVMTDGIPDVSQAKKKCTQRADKLKLTAMQKKAADDIFSLVITENLKLDEAETQRRKDSAALSIPEIEYKKGQVIVRKGEIITSSQHSMLASLGVLKGTSPISAGYTIGVSLLLLICFLIFAFFFSHFTNKSPTALPIAALTGLIVVLVTFYGAKYISEKMIPILPAGLFPGIVTIFSTPLTAAVSNLAISIFCGIAFDANWGYTICLIVAGTLSSYCFASVKRRAHLLPATFVSSFFYGLVFCSMSLIESSSASLAFASFSKGFAGGFISGLITIGSLPFFEWLFNATTPMKLTELANPENKLLKKLLVEAPGTYHHSLTVANISEIAARSIKADTLLARVGAYYHDIGKIRHPLYFKENQYDLNPHDSLTPQKSASVILKHVADGEEIAQKHRLPKAICDIIAQHHGTTAAGYFLSKAKELDKNINEDDFFYSGPVPQSKEAAIVMMADSCEAAVRSLSDKSEGKIEAMVRRIATERVNSGQFSECNMTFTELETVIKVIIKTLGGYFHERIKYE